MNDKYLIKKLNEIIGKKITLPIHQNKKKNLIINYFLKISDYLIMNQNF